MEETAQTGTGEENTGARVKRRIGDVLGGVEKSELDVWARGKNVLTTPAEEVVLEDWDISELKKLLSSMFSIMYRNSGVGLAAPQIGLGLRLAVIDASKGVDANQQIVAINPIILAAEGSQRESEGCLSIPGVFEPLTRYQKVLVELSNLEGKRFKMEADGFLSRIFQHEVDHLDGVLFVNRMKPVQRDILRRKARKQKKGSRLGIIL